MEKNGGLQASSAKATAYGQEFVKSILERLAEAYCSILGLQSSKIVKRLTKKLMESVTSAFDQVLHPLCRRSTASEVPCLPCAADGGRQRHVIDSQSIDQDYKSHKQSEARMHQDVSSCATTGHLLLKIS